MLLAGILVAWVLALRHPVAAQDAGEWRWSHPAPHGNNIADLVYRSGLWTHVTDHGGIYGSTNRLVWERRTSGTSRDLRGLAYLGHRLLVVGEAGTALWSDDGIQFQAATVTPPTTNWFEGVAASGTRAVAVGDAGTVYQTTNGLSWTRVVGTGITNWLSGAAFGAGVFVAVGETGFISSSATGTNGWTRRTSGTTANLTRIAFGDSRVGADARFLVTSEAGSLHSSVNGTSWALDGASGTTSPLYAGAIGVGERIATGESALLLRKTATGWADQTSDLLSPSPAPAWTYAAAAHDGTRFLVAGRTGVFVESWRTNSGALAGQTFWIRNDDAPRNWLWEVDRFAGTYLAVGDRATILSSPSGLDWSLEVVPVDSTVVLYGIGGSPERAVAVGSGGTILISSVWYTNVTASSTVSAGGRDITLAWTNRVSLIGLNWEAVNSTTSETLQGIAWNGTSYVAVGANGVALRSPDARTWTRQTISGAGFLSSVAPMPGGWVASGAAGAIYTSPDAVSWTKRTTGTTNWIYRVRTDGTDRLAVGQNGVLLTSTNGLTWISRTTGTSAWLTDARKVGAQWYVSGTQGTILRSGDLATWTPVSTVTGKALYGLSAMGGQLIAAGAEGVIVRSVVEPAATPVALKIFQHRSDGDPVIDVFGFEGVPEQSFRLEMTDELGNWGTEKATSIDSGGMAFHGRIASEVRKFYRTRSPQ